MTAPEQNPTPEQIHEAFRQMRLRLRNYALHQFDHIDLRTVAVLDTLDLTEGLTDDDSIPSVGEGVDLPVILDPAHSRRIKLPPGPLVLYLTEDDPPRRMVVELPVLLYSELSDVRRAGFDCLSRMVAEGELEVTPKTKAVLEASRGGIFSETPSDWRRAAIELFDAFLDDVLVPLQGLRQCLESEPVIQDSLNTYVARVIHPTVSSLDSINLDVRNPETEHPRLEEIVTDVVAEASSLRDACARYFSRLGYLPLAPPYSMADVVSQWMATHPETDVWTEVWDWARGSLGPLPRYHACAVFAVHPELAPQGQLPQLWREIVAVVHDAARKGSDNIEHEPWALRRDLARHFAYHLEAHLPDNDGANIACFAWWFAERVASLFPDEAKSAQFYREKWVAQALEQSTHIWLAASPRIGMCFLRYVTATVSSPWGTALLALMGAKLDALAPQEQPEEIRALFHEALVSCLLGSLPFPVDSPSAPTYGQECSLAETALKWAVHAPEAEQNAMQQLVATSRTLGSTEGLCAALRKLAESSLADQVAVTLALKAKAYTDPAIASGVWEVLSDADWRERVLGTVEERVLGLLIEAFSILQVSEQDKWFSLLPHYVAELCENAEDDEPRRQLFLYVVHMSLASDTVSAVRRLLRGSQKTRFVEMARDYRERVEGSWILYPSWVRGRLRGLLSALHVV